MMLSAETRLGPYEIVAPLGAGGMGEVYRARDTRLAREVAIKVLPESVARDPVARQRFEREARAISQLSHPNICTLHDVGDGYLVMELLVGETLAQRMRKGALPLSDVLKFGSQIADALGKAHDAGVVHRDLKPGNVMITKSGAKLLDFGLAKALPRRSEASSGETTLHVDRLTEAGAVVGTLPYMAPEQIGGEEPDHRTDIFALGVVLYEMTAGRRPFDAASAASLIAMIATAEPPPLTELRSETPAALERLIRKCLRKDKHDRWQNAYDVAEQLSWLAAGDTSEQPRNEPQRRTPKQRLRRAGFATLTLMIGAAAVFGAYRVGARSAPGNAGVAFEIAATSSLYSDARDALISNDGTRIVFNARNDQNESSLWIRNLSLVEPVALAGADGTPLAWTHDDRFILFGSRGKLFRIPAAGGPVQELADAPEPLGATANADGIILFAGGGTGLMRIESTGAVRKFTSVNAAAKEVAHVFPSFLPDGRHFLFTALRFDSSDAAAEHRLYVGDLEGGAPRLIGEFPSAALYSNGHLLTVRQRNLVAIPFDARTLTITGDAVPLLDNVSFFQPQADNSISVSRTGALVCRDWNRMDEPRRRAADGTISALPYSLFRPWGDASTSADGDSLVVADLDPQRGTTDIWRWSLASGTQTRLTFDRWIDMAPVLSPDGTTVYFASARDGWPDIYAKTIGSAAPGNVVVSAPRYQRPLDVSPDGRYLLYHTDQNASSGYDLYALDLETSGARPQVIAATPASEGFRGRFSRDGKSVVYTSDESGTFEVYVNTFPQLGVARQLTSGGAWEPRFSRDGRTLLFTRGAKVMAADFDAASMSLRNERMVFEPAASLWLFELQSDGSILFQTDSGARSPNIVFTDWTTLLRR